LKLLKNWDFNVILALSVKTTFGVNLVKRKHVVIQIVMVNILLLAKELARKVKLLLLKPGKVSRRALLLLVFHALLLRDTQL